MKRLLIVSFGMFFFMSLCAQETKVIYGDSKPGAVSLKTENAELDRKDIEGDRTKEKPEIRWTGTIATQTTNSQLVLEALIQPKGELFSVTIFHNDLPIPYSFDKVRRQVDLRKIVQLQKGENYFKVRAINEAGVSVSSEITIVYTPEDPVNQRKDYAILFATANYERESGFDKLPNTIEGAEALEKVLEDKYGFDDVIVIRDPTKATISKTLIEFAKRNFDIYDQLFVFYTGHGTIDDLGRGYFVSSKGKTTDQFTSHNDFLDLVNLINCPHIMVVADACYSGRMSRYDRGAMSVSDDKPKRGSRLYRNKNNYEFIKAMLDEQKKTRIFIASGSNKVPSGIKGRYTPFMFRFLESFEKANQDDEFLEYVELQKWLNKLQASTPVYGVFGSGSPNGTFLFMGQ